MKIMTPLHISLMLHYYVKLTPYSEHDAGHRYSEATIQYTKQLLAADMLTLKDYEQGLYEVTDKGRAYINALMSVKEPVCKWVQPEEE